MFAEHSSTLATVVLQNLQFPHLVNNLAAVFCNDSPQQPVTCPYPDPQVLLNYPPTYLLHAAKSLRN
jgi:hypothetical protein